MEFMRFSFLFLLFGLFSACSFDQVECSVVKNNKDSQSVWTFVVYMAADNNLEEFSILDVKEMERSMTATSGITTLVLLDRSQGNDATNGDWTDTRLYKIKNNSSLSDATICSERISCPELGLSSEVSTELNMASSSTLAGVLSFARREYPSEHLGLIIWGHGNGSSFISDQNSSSEMKISELREGIESGIGTDKLDFIGFDTCFAAELEVLYELKDLSTYFAGSPNLVKDSGWNYTLFLGGIAEAILQKKDAEPISVAQIAKEAFEKTYNNSSESSFLVAKMSEVQNLFNVFDDLCASAAKNVLSSTNRDELFLHIFSNTKSFSASTTSCYKFLSVEDFSHKLLDFDESLLEKTSLLESALQKTILCDSYQNRLGVFFCNLTQSGNASVLIPKDFCRNSTNLEPMLFVRDSAGYVATGTESASLIDKLFYTSF